MFPRMLGLGFVATIAHALCGSLWYLELTTDVPAFRFCVSAVMATALITRVAKDALEKAIEAHEATAPETSELVARSSDTSTSSGSASTSVGVRMASPKASLSAPFQTKSSGAKAGKQQGVQGSDLGLKEAAKNVLVRIEGSLLHSPKVEKGG